MTGQPTGDDFEIGLAALGASPRDQGVLVMIVCRPEVGDRYEMKDAELDMIDGLIGDS